MRKPKTRKKMEIIRKHRPSRASKIKMAFKKNYKSAPLKSPLNKRAPKGHAFSSRPKKLGKSRNI